MGAGTQNAGPCAVSQPKRQSCAPARGSGRSPEGKKPRNHGVRVLVTSLEHSARTLLLSQPIPLAFLVSKHLPETSWASCSKSPSLGALVRRAPRPPALSTHL